MMLAATRLGYLYALNERFSEALAMYEEAYQHAPDHYHRALIASIIGVTNIKNGDIAHGLDYIGQAEALRSSLKMGESDEMTRVDLNIAEAYLCAQEEEKAISYLNNILEVSVEPAILARAYELLSYACRAWEFYEQASFYAAKSFENYITAGYRSEAARVALTLDELTQGEYRDLAERLADLDASMLRERSPNLTNSPLQYLAHY
jgi:tetratricopeptide (TPR) repeat protein